LLFRKKVYQDVNRSNSAIPVYALSEEDIVNYIESCPENSKASKKKKRKNKTQGKTEHNKIQRSIPLLKGFERNFITPDSSADRTTATSHSINGESTLKEVKKVFN